MQLYVEKEETTAQRNWYQIQIMSVEKSYSCIV